MHLPFPLPPPPPLILLFLHYIRRSFDLLSRLYACRSFHRFFHPFTIVPFHPSQVIRVQPPRKSRFRQTSRNASIPVNRSRSCNYMHFSSNSLSLFLSFLSLRHASPLSPGKGALESLKRGATVLSSWHPRFSPRPRPNRVYLPNFTPIHPSSFQTHETPDEL